MGLQAQLTSSPSDDTVEIATGRRKSSAGEATPTITGVAGGDPEAEGDIFIGIL